LEDLSAEKMAAARGVLADALYRGHSLSAPATNRRHRAATPSA
jgi:hypothetical protein